MSVIKSTTGQNNTEHFRKKFPQRKLDRVLYLCYHQCNNQEIVYTFTIPPSNYIDFYLLLKKTMQRNTVNKHIEEPSEFIGTYRLQFRTDQTTVQMNSFNLRLEILSILAYVLMKL